jgi:hypothetical protein
MLWLFPKLRDSDHSTAQQNRTQHLVVDWAPTGTYLVFFRLRLGHQAKFAGPAAPDAASVALVGCVGMKDHSCMHACYTCGRSSSEQRQPIPIAADHTKQQTDHTNNKGQLPSKVMGKYAPC